MSDPDLIYFDALPFKGYHSPPWLRIQDRTFKTSGNAVYVPKPVKIEDRPKWEPATMMSSREVAEFWRVPEHKINQLVNSKRLECKSRKLVRDGRAQMLRVFDRKYIEELDPKGLVWK